MAKSVDAQQNTAPTLVSQADVNKSKPPLRTPVFWALMAVSWLGMFVFAFHSCTRMVAAGDTWVAMACGRHFVQHGVDTVEPFSANSHHAGPTEAEIETWPGWAQSIANTVGIKAVRYWHPTGWVNQNWLTHVILYWLTTTLGSEEEPYYDALVYWKFALYFLTVLCVYATARVIGVHPVLAAAAACFAMFVGRSFLDIRPAGFSNLMVAVFVLLLSLATYRHILYIWLIVPLTVLWCNLHGGYIYVFIMLAPFVGLNLLAIPFKNSLVSIGSKGISHTIMAGCTALIATIVFNPFHLTNLTHTFVISVSKHAERWRQVHEWHRAFDWSNPVGTAKPFLVLVILAVLGLAAWIVVQKLTVNSVYAKAPKLRKKRGNRDLYQWPKFDLALMTVAALTIYMAIRSRRFIPIAAFAACPFVALLIDQTIRSLWVADHFHTAGVLTLRPMTETTQNVIFIVCAAIVTFFGTWLGVRYKRVYLDPWPPDPQYSSVFMRMTASFAKPFDVGQFMQANQLSGKMMNYWTEGGAIAFGQCPDPQTGKTPLQLFMDGRAQAAYDRKAFDQWHNLWGGGQIEARRQYEGKTADKDHYIKLGDWLGNELRKRDVWVALVPQGQFHRPFCRGLEHNPRWPIVFLNNKQKLFVDYESEQGKALFMGIAEGTTVYPNEFTRLLNLGRFHLVHNQGEGAKKKGLDLLIQAFDLNPTPAPILEIMTVAYPHQALHGDMATFCRKTVDDFESNRQAYLDQDGYRGRLESARIACAFLTSMARRQGDTKGAKLYAELADSYSQERDLQGDQTRW